MSLQHRSHRPTQQELPARDTQLAPLRVLHLTEAMGGGVQTALSAYVDATRELEHHIVFRARDFDTQSDPNFESARPVTGSLRDLSAALRDSLSILKPHVLHAHSSWAGFVARTRPSRTPVVYTPHCFAFRRRDLSPTARRSFWHVEKMLASRTSVLVAASPQEAALARALGHSHIIVAPHRAPSLRIPGSTTGRRSRVVLGTMGRVMPQKGVAWFCSLVDRIVRNKLPVDFKWIGSGDARLEAKLRDRGVIVTGWLTQPRALEELGLLDLYIHSAAWEVGIPYAILEAIASEVPILARAIQELVQSPLRPWTVDLERLSELLPMILADPSHLKALAFRQQPLLLRYTLAAQRSALLRAYATAISHHKVDQ